MPDGVFWWALGCLPSALLLNSRLLVMQALILALIWFFLEVGLEFYPALFAVFIAAGLLVLYRGKQSVVLFLMVVGSIGVWLEYSLSAYWRTGRHYDLHPEHVPVSVGLFILVYALGHWLNRKKATAAKDYGVALSLWSLRFGLLFMLVMSFRGGWEGLLSANWQHKASMFALLSMMALISLLLARAAERARNVILMLSFFFATLFAVLIFGNAMQAIYFQILFNVVLILWGVWLIIKGIHEGISHYFFLGVMTIFLTAFMRYIDLIGDYIGGAALFGVFAVLLLGAAKYWKYYQAKGQAKEQAL